MPLFVVVYSFVCHIGPLGSNSNKMGFCCDSTQAYRQAHVCKLSSLEIISTEVNTTEYFSVNTYNMV